MLRRLITFAPIDKAEEVRNSLFAAGAGHIGKYAELLSKNDLSAKQKRNVELTQEDYAKNKKYSSEFVRSLSEQVNKAFHSWIDARKKNDFGVYKKDLDVLIQLKKQETDILGYEHHPYNALLDEFEKGATVQLLDKTFADILPSLQEFVKKISGKPQVDDSFLQQHFPKQQQWAWGIELIKKFEF